MTKMQAGLWQVKLGEHTYEKGKQKNGTDYYQSA